MGVDKRVVLMVDVDVEAVYREYRPMVAAKVRGDIGDSQNVDDVVSEVFLDFARFVKSGRFNGTAQPQTVLFTITERRIADFFRNKKRETENYTKKARDEASRIRSRPVDFVLDFEIRSLFTKVIDSLEILSEREKQVFWRHGVAEESVSDLSERMGISESLVTQLYTEAKKKLAVAIRNAVKGQPSGLSAKEKAEWLDRFFYAYLRLGEKGGHLTEGMKLAAAQAHVAIRSGCKDG